MIPEGFASQAGHSIHSTGPELHCGRRLVEHLASQDAIQAQEPRIQLPHDLENHGRQGYLWG